MKKQFLIFLMLFVINSYLKAQSTAIGHNWALVNFLGFNVTNGPNPLNIRTNNLNRIIVTQLPVGSPLISIGPTATNPIANFGLTRIGISFNATSPITNPQSALHIGFDNNSSGIIIIGSSFPSF